MDKIQLQNRTKRFAIRVFKMIERLPRSKGTDVITYQLIKASSSVAANYRAVCRAKSKEDIILNLGNFLFEYNHLRRHGGLNYETPFDKLQKVTELLS